MSDKPISNEESDRYYDRYQRSRDIPLETEVPQGDMDTFDEVSGRRIETEDQVEVPPVAATAVEEQELDSRLTETPLESVPDADLVQPNSPVDPAAPDPDALHGTDLLNGAGADAKPQNDILPRERQEPDNLVTERDIDPKFGLFTEDSFPEALKDEDQRDAVEHAIPKEKASRKDSPSEH
ncbi:hypothetical protein [Paenibacillus sp. QZ-Y1]|uniref:hypothetical protein n=1 Tax=Paenibacillus sp. QZ-Y1 TaxID=3414511 RepID=UPI003F7AEB0A